MISHLDHLVLTTANEIACIDFYTRVLGMALETFIGGTPPVERKAFRFGDQKINLHVRGKELEPKAHAPTPGSLDLCFISTLPLEAVVGRVRGCQWPIIEGPVLRTGATGRIRSIYLRDPDSNLIEIAELLVVTTQRDDDAAAAFASPPCFLHEVDPAYSGLAPPADLPAWSDIQQWRAAERARLLTARLAMPPSVRRAKDAAIAAHLEAILGDVAGLVVSAYQAIDGEPDLCQLLERLVASGARTALPVVVAPDRPLAFRYWAPGESLHRGVRGIPIPRPDAEAVVPDILIVPVVGFDSACHRLGHGGGFFDRTLAAMLHQPRIIGVGYAQAAIATIHPQPHDIPMHVVVTEHGSLGRGD
jgi:5,10-methenyltetrahydrofolate synthetase